MIACLAFGTVVLAQPAPPPEPSRADPNDTARAEPDDTSKAESRDTETKPEAAAADDQDEASPADATPPPEPNPPVPDAQPAAPLPEPPAPELQPEPAPAPRTPAPAPAPSAEIDSRVLFGGIAMGVGGAAILAGSIVGIVAASRYADIDCPNDVCAPDQLDEAEDYNDLRIPSGVTVAAGSLVAFVGGIFLISGMTDEGTVHLSVGPQSLSLSGTF